MTRTLLVIVLALATLAALTFAWRAPRGADAPPEAVAATIPSADEVKGLFLSRGCVGCHDVRRPLVGPAFVAVAERYADLPDAESVLLASLREGSQARWGAGAMPMQRAGKLGDDEAIAMVRWILAQHDPDAPSVEGR